MDTISTIYNTIFHNLFQGQKRRKTGRKLQNTFSLPWYSKKAIVNNLCSGLQSAANRAKLTKLLYSKRRNGEIENMEENRTEELTEETAVVEETTPAEETVPAEEVPAEETPAQESAPAQIKEGMKATPGKIALMIGAIIVVAALIIAMLVGTLGNDKAEGETIVSEPSAATEETVPATIPADGNPDDETCKGSYTASDEEVKAAADTVVATAGEYELTNAELQVYYWLGIQNTLQTWSYYSNAYGFDYAAMMGLDYTQPLDTQICTMVENGATWQQYFLLNALQSWHYYQSLEVEAINAGFDVDAEKREFLDNLETSLAEDAVNYGFETAEEYLAYNAGPGATMESYLNFMEQNYRGYDYYDSLVNAIELTDEELDAYYTENEAALVEQGVGKDAKFVDVRHILIMPESTTAEDGTTTVTDEAWAAAAAEAERILNEWKSGAATEESFGELANTYTADGNDANYDGIPDGGLYTEVYVGQMVPEFENWCFDETRQIGDTGLVKTTYGWHVMYFVQSYPSQQWKTAAESALRSQRSNELIEDISAKYPLSVDYSKILLGYLNLGE